MEGVFVRLPTLSPLWIFCGLCCLNIVLFPALLSVWYLFFALKHVAVWYREWSFCCFIAWPWLSTYSWGISKWYSSGVVPFFYSLFLCHFSTETLISAASSSLGPLYSAWTLPLCILGNCPEAQCHGASYLSLTLPVVHCLKSIASYILSGFIVAYGRRANSIRVTPPWMEARTQPHLRVEIDGPFKSLEVHKFFALRCLSP